MAYKTRQVQLGFLWAIEPETKYQLLRSENQTEPKKMESEK